MRNELLVKTLNAGGPISPRRICKFGADDSTMIQATAASDSLVCTSNELGSVLGERQGFVFEGLAEIEYGGAITRGDLLTSDANGKAVVAAGANRIIGVALQSGVAGDIGSLRLMPSAPGGTFANVSSTATEINTLDGAPSASTIITVGAEAANTINVGIQMKDADGANLAARAVLSGYFSDNADGSTLIAVVPSGAVAIGTNGLLLVTEAKKQFKFIANGTGAVDINITEAAAKTLYLVLCLPNGKLKISPAVTFV